MYCGSGLTFSTSVLQTFDEELAEIKEVLKNVNMRVKKKKSLQLLNCVLGLKEDNPFPK
jgi:hypothetical protein